jgi:hypothetical protein
MRVTASGVVELLLKGTADFTSESSGGEDGEVTVFEVVTGSYAAFVSLRVSGPN